MVTTLVGGAVVAVVGAARVLGVLVPFVARAVARVVRDAVTRAVVFDRGVAEQGAGPTAVVRAAVSRAAVFDRGVIVRNAEKPTAAVCAALNDLSYSSSRSSVAAESQRILVQILLCRRRPSPTCATKLLAPLFCCRRPSTTHTTEPSPFLRSHIPTMRAPSPLPSGPFLRAARREAPAQSNCIKE